MLRYTYIACLVVISVCRERLLLSDPISMVASYTKCALVHRIEQGLISIGFKSETGLKLCESVMIGVYRA